MKRLTPWLLLLLLLGAQTVQAWHGPEHIHDTERGGTVTHDQACPFGVNGHGAALIGEFRLEVRPAAADTAPYLTRAIVRTAEALVPPARAPPSSRL